MVLDQLSHSQVDSFTLLRILAAALLSPFLSNWCLHYFLTLSALVHFFSDLVRGLCNEPAREWCWYFLLSSTSKDICCGCARLACKDKLVLITVQLYGIACYTDWIWSYRTGASYHTFYSSEYFLVWAYLWKSISEIYTRLYLLYIIFEPLLPGSKRYR